MRFIKFTASVMVGALGAAGIAVGTVMVFASFFFEQTWAEMTWTIAGQHLLVFIIGAAFVGAAGGVFLKLLEWTDA